MKQLCLLLLVALSTQFVTAQKMSAVVFSENGEKFTLYLNGVAQNEAPQSNVNLGELELEAYQARVDFEDPTLADFSNNYFMLHPGFTVSYMIKVNRKGNYVLRFQSETAYQDVIPVREPEIASPPAPHRPVIESEMTDIAVASETTTTTQTVTTTTKFGDSPSEEKVGVTMKAPGVDVTFGVDMDIDMDMDMGMDMGMDIDMGSEMTVTESITTTTTTSTSEVTTPRMTRPVEEGIVPISGCYGPADGMSFGNLKRSIASKDFEDSKMTIAKQAIPKKCLTSSQIKELMIMMDFEDTKLELAKFAYDHVYDTDNYYVVNDAFEFELTIDDLMEYLETK